MVTPAWFKTRGNKCCSGKSYYCMLILMIPLLSFRSLPECMSAIHWGSHVEVPNSCNISCSNSSLLECSPVTWVRFPAETCLSRGALVEDGDGLGPQVSSLYGTLGAQYHLLSVPLLMNRTHRPGFNPSFWSEIGTFCYWSWQSNLSDTVVNGIEWFRPLGSTEN